jgi:rhodanese-related sulfurtransferase
MNFNDIATASKGLFAVFTLLILFATSSALATNSSYRSPEEAPGATTVTVDEAKWLYDDDAVFIDVRNPRYFANRHIPGAHHLDMKDVFTEQALAAVADKDEPIVIYASSERCGRAYKGARLAVSWGYKNVYYFRGGIVDWKSVEFPINSNKVLASK